MNLDPEFIIKLDKQTKRNNAVANCENCNNNPEWERRTQFAGNHPFCDVHARLEPDFGTEDSSYFYWHKIDA